MLIIGAMNAFAYEALRYNPFERPGTNAADRGAPGNVTAAANLQLRGTVIDGKDSMANIDGEYYRLNDQVSGFRVIRIETGSVTLRRGADHKVLTLHQHEQANR